MVKIFIAICKKGNYGGHKITVAIGTIAIGVGVVEKRAMGFEPTTFSLGS